MMGEQQVISDEIFPPIDQEKTIKQVRRFLDKKLRKQFGRPAIRSLI